MAVKLDDVMEAINESGFSLVSPGFCLSCGEYADGVEPDAHGYRCDACGEYAVAGAEHILLTGQYEEA